MYRHPAPRSAAADRRPPARHLLLRSALALACLAAAAGSTQAAPTCYPKYTAVAANAPNKLFLYFPAFDDPTWPAYDTGVSPARTFDAALLPGAPAVSTAQLRNRIFDVVSTDYCEFNVEVMGATTTNPNTLPSPPARRNMVAIGADANPGLFGEAQNVDTGDALAVDHARVWGGTYGNACSAELSGAGNTLDHWAMGIGGTAAHEAGHNYGLSHGAGSVLHAGEDALTNHIMPAGGSIPCSDRVNHLRHFSDNDYGILANNVGLAVQSLANWDFINPNAGAAHGLCMEVLSLSPTLTAVWDYRGNTSPWVAPTVTAAGTKLFKGLVYRRYFVTWQSPNVAPNPYPWPGAPGTVAGGAPFHVGANFAEEPLSAVTNQVVIVDTELLDAANNPLPLHPRVPTYNTGTLSPDGLFHIELLNLVNAAMVIRNPVAWVLPRQVDILAMRPGFAAEGKLFDVRNQPVTPWRRVQLPAAVELPAGSPDQPGRARLAIGNLFKDGHNIKIRTAATTGRDSAGGSEVNRDVPRTLLTDPFPGAAVYLEADLVEPSAVQWDPAVGAYVQREGVTKVFLQVAGQRVKPVLGNTSGLLRGKVVCTNLNTRQSVNTALANNAFDCEQSGLVSLHGDRIELTQVGIASSALPAVQLGGLEVGKVTCTNLSTRRSVSFKPERSTDTLDCAKAGLAVKPEQTVEIVQVGTAR